MGCGRLTLLLVTVCFCLRGEVRLSGKVVSDTDAPIPNAQIVMHPASDPLTNLRAFSDASGVFSLELPGTGDYLANVEADGFYTLTNRRVSITGAETELKLVLNPIREFSDSVQVSGQSSAVALDHTNSQESLSGKTLLDIPYPTTHDLKYAMRILPGVVQDSSGGIHVNGGAENQVLYLLDGFDISDPLTGDFDTRISVESVQSMDVLSGRFSAEYGKGSAGVVEVNTKSGDNRFRYSATNFIPGIDHNDGWRIGTWNPRFNFSGPVRKDRAWFADSFTGQYSPTVVPELPPGQNMSTSLRYSNFLHTQVNLTPSNILYAGFLSDWWSANRTGLSALDPPATTPDQRARQWFADVKDQQYIGDGAVFEFGYAANRTFSRIIPQGDALYIESLQGRGGNYYINGEQRSSRDQVIANLFLPSFHFGGAHQLQMGIDFDRVGYSQNMDRTGIEWLDAADTPVRQVLYAGDGQLAKSNFETSAYLQDSWRARSNVLLELGVRSDWDSLLRNWNVSPRLGFAWSPRHWVNTKISGGYAIMYNATNLQLFTRPEDQYPVTTYYPPYGTGTVAIPSLFVINGRFASPRYQTLSVSLDQRLFSSVYLRAQVLRRRGEKGLAYFDSAELGAAGLVPGITPGSANIYELTNGRSDWYDSAELTVRQNFHKEYEWLASYTRSRARSTSVIDLSSDDPAIVANDSGPLPWDTPNRLLGWGYLPTPWKTWAIAFLAEYRTGFPFSVENDAGYVIGPVNSYRYPNFFELDLHVEKRFRFHGQLWAGRAGYNNITNHQNPNTVNNIIGAPEFLTYYGGQGRALVFRIRWLGKL
jgi:Carboxypeptidase regulatory-like domain/TonB-dependent Receptor Plug Domain